jgi:hypothetical protein
MFPQQYHMPGVVGLTESDKGIVDLVKSLLKLQIPTLTGAFGKLLNDFVHDLPRKVFDWMMGKLPGIIVDAVKDAVGGFFRAVTPFGLGGTVRRDGPMVLGDRGRPEVLWGSRGQFIEANTNRYTAAAPGGVAGGAADPLQGGIHFHGYGDPVTPATISTGIRMVKTGQTGRRAS